MSLCAQLTTIFSGGSKGGGARDTRPPGGPNSFNFMQFYSYTVKSRSHCDGNGIILYYFGAVATAVMNGFNTHS